MGSSRWLLWLFPLSLYFILREVLDPIPDKYSRSLSKSLNGFWIVFVKLFVPIRFVSSAEADDTKIDVYFQLGTSTSEPKLQLDFLTKDVVLSSFGFLDLQSLRNCALVCREWYILSSSDEFWKIHCLKVLRNFYLDRFSRNNEAISVADNVLNKVFLASKSNKKIVYAISNIDFFQWKQFLATTRFCDRYSGSGRSVVINRDEVKPHHVLKFIHKLGEEKQPEFALEILEKFLGFYLTRDKTETWGVVLDSSTSRKKRNEAFNSTLISKGYIFRDRVACSVREFEEFVNSVPGLTVPALLEFFD